MFAGQWRNGLAKYPISHNGSKKLGEFFEQILAFHIPPSKEKMILDPTCGKKHLWAEYLKKDFYGKTKLEEYGQVVFSDIKPYDQEIVSDLNSLSARGIGTHALFDSRKSNL